VRGLDLSEAIYIQQDQRVRPSSSTYFISLSIILSVSIKRHLVGILATGPMSRMALPLLPCGLSLG
jgi:hypothetical protein